jgi:ubiquinone/menaquinone biosynthesis C-methylase UbiE
MWHIAACGRARFDAAFEFDTSPIARARCFSFSVRARAATRYKAKWMNSKGEQKALDPLPPQAIPSYLQDTYWWAYVHPNAVSFFERQWLVNLILWGNFARLRDAALAELGREVAGRTLQVACVYGNFSEHLAARVAPGGSLDIVDVLPIQLRNLRQKLPASAPVTLHQSDSTALGFDDASYDQAILFFLLHEQPAAARRQTLREALRVVKPGGKLVLVDYHLPVRLHPLRYLFRPVLRALEPFALDLWQHELAQWLPDSVTPAQIRKETYFGGLYQKLVITV